MLAYHYTLVPDLLGIVRDREIRLSQHVPMGWGVSAVWFSVNPIFDNGKGTLFHHPDSNKPFIMDMDEQAENFGLARIAVDDADTWTLHRAHQTGFLSASSLHGYWTGAIQCGANPLDWRVSPRAIPASAWHALEVFDNGKWLPADPDRLRPLIARYHEFSRDYEARVAPLIARHNKCD